MDERDDDDPGVEVILPRSGQAPLRFRGRLIAEASGLREEQRRQRWHELRVWRTPGGNYVVAVAYRTQWPHDIDHDMALVCKSPREAAAAFRTYDPCARILGVPLGERMEEKREEIMREVRRRYDALVSAVLMAPEFAEDVP